MQRFLIKAIKAKAVLEEHNDDTQYRNFVVVFEALENCHSSLNWLLVRGILILVHFVTLHWGLADTKFLVMGREWHCYSGESLLITDRSGSGKPQPGLLDLEPRAQAIGLQHLSQPCDIALHKRKNYTF